MQWDAKHGCRLRLLQPLLPAHPALPAQQQPQQQPAMALLQPPQ